MAGKPYHEVWRVMADSLGALWEEGETPMTLFNARWITDNELHTRK